jgi:1-deoxy-D-xylulose-5-phosphate synthase
MANVAMRAAERSERSVAVYDLCYVKPLDTNMLDDIASRFDKIITIEDGVIRGGVGESVSAYIARKGGNIKVVNLGIEDRFVEHGKPSELYAECGYDERALLQTISNI